MKIKGYVYIYSLNWDLLALDKLRRDISKIIHGETKSWQTLVHSGRKKNTIRNSGNPLPKISWMLWSYFARLAWKLLKQRWNWSEINQNTHDFLFHFLALLLFVVTQENRKVSMRSKLWWCEVQKSGIFGLFTGWIFFLSSQGGAFVSQSNLDLSNLISFFSFSAFSGNFRHFLLHKFWQQRSGRRCLVCVWDSTMGWNHF